MKRIVHGRRPDPMRICLTVTCILVLGVFAPPFRSGSAAVRRLPEMTAQQELQLGEKMYRNGILPSGKPMQAAIPGGLQAPGTTFACISCHARSGLGSTEEKNRTPAINGKSLFQPLYAYFPNLLPSERATMVPARFQAPPVREAYRDATLVAAIREGIDPAGRHFKPGMPRYRLSDGDLKILIHYLKSLSSQPSPGVTEQTMAFATVITDEVSQEDRDAMLGVLERGIQNHNNLGGNRGFMGAMLNMQVMRLSFRTWSLTSWIVKGPPDAWQDQLREYYSREPVFALVGGLSYGSWEPVHQFCESKGIPCILPITDLPVVSAADYYTLYFSKGYYQEGEAAARYLNNSANSANPREIVQVVGPGPEARALARGFEETWSEMGKKPVETLALKDETELGGEILAGLVQRGKNCDLLLWTGPKSYGALDTLAAAPGRPATVFMSSSLLRGRLWDLPSKAREFTLVTYPWREPGEKKVIPPMGGRPQIVNKEFRKNDLRISSRTNTIVEILTSVVSMMERNFYRDYLLDSIDQKGDQNTTDYEKLTFGPGKRYASEGCYIMQLSEDPQPTIIPRSEWILH